MASLQQPTQLPILPLQTAPPTQSQPLPNHPLTRGRPHGTTPGLSPLLTSPSPWSTHCPLPTPPSQALIPTSTRMAPSSESQQLTKNPICVSSMWNTTLRTKASSSLPSQRTAIPFIHCSQPAATLASYLSPNLPISSIYFLENQRSDYFQITPQSQTTITPPIPALDALSDLATPP